MQTAFTGTAGNDNFTGTGADDTFDMTQGGKDKVTGKAGDDSFDFGATLTALDKIDGGNNGDVFVGLGDELVLTGDYSAGMVLNATTVTNVEQMSLLGTALGGGSYNFTLDDGNVAADAFMIIWLFDPAGSGDTLTIDGSAETDGHLVLRSNTSGSDTLIGGADNDYINGGRGGTDTLTGGGGANRVSFSSVQTTGVTVSLLLQGAAQDVGGGRMVTMTDFVDLSGSFQADTLIGDGNDNWILSVGGNDTIDADAGNDLVDIADASMTAATADGGLGIDTLSFLYWFSNNLPVTFSLALQGVAQVIDGTRSVTATNFENVSGTGLNDIITGDGDDNSLFGLSGDDTLDGGDGNDYLGGDKFSHIDADANLYTRSGFEIGDDGNGKDTLAGGKGNDTLDGGAGKDKLMGGAQTDTLNGGAGADQFIFKKATESGAGSGNRDVLDFSQTDHDVMNLHAIDADTATSGNQDFFLGGGTFTGLAGELIQFDDGSGHTIVAGDVNADSVADFELQLTTALVVVAGDFVF